MDVKKFPGDKKAAYRRGTTGMGAARKLKEGGHANAFHIGAAIKVLIKIVVVHGDTALVFFTVPVAVAAGGRFFVGPFFFGIAFHWGWQGHTSGSLIAIHGLGTVIATRIFDDAHISFTAIDFFTKINGLFYELASVLTGDICTGFGGADTVCGRKTGEIGVMTIAVAVTGDGFTTVNGAPAFIHAGECGGSPFLASNSQSRTNGFWFARKRIVGIDDDHAARKGGKAQCESSET